MNSNRANTNKSEPKINALKLITESLHHARVQPSEALNLFVQTHNQEGPAALYALEENLVRLLRQLSLENDPSRNLARAWLEALRAYMEVNASVQPIRLPQLSIADRFALRAG